MSTRNTDHGYNDILCQSLMLPSPLIDEDSVNTMYLCAVKYLSKISNMQELSLFMYKMGPHDSDQ
jgi:hypothetical protein